MGLDIMFVQPHYEYGFRAGSYTGFNQFRTVLAAEENINLSKMDGFGGEEMWETTDTVLEPLLAHSDCDGFIYPMQVEEGIPRLKAILVSWEDGEFAYSTMFPDAQPFEDEDKAHLVSLLRHWIEAFERIVENEKKGLNEFIQFS